MTRLSHTFIYFLILCCISVVLTSRSQERRTVKKSSSVTAKSSRNPNPTDAFCKKFTAECYHLSLSGKEGHVKVIHSCERNGNKFSSSYSFGCKANGVDKTQAVLNAIGSVYTYTSTVSGSTVVVTGTATAVATSLSTVVSEVDVTTVVDVTATNSETLTESDTVTTVETATLTTAIPVTITSTTTSIVTTTTPVTTTVATSTVTSVYLGTNAVPVLEVVVGTAGARKRSNKVDSSKFCSAFSTACTSQCTKVKSTPTHVICHATSALHYSLTCYCKNTKVETQHALAAAVKQESIVTVSTLSTSTTYATVTSTTVMPTTILSTSIHTITSTVPITRTYTSSSTITKTSLTTSYPGVSTTVSTAVPTTTATATATTTISTTATSSTQIVLATTGAVQAYSTADDSSQGYIYYDSDSGFFYTTTDETQAIIFMAVYDSASGLYQLQLTDGSGEVFIAEAGFSGDDYSADGSAYSWTYPGASSLCGTSGTAAGPPAGSGSLDGNACETFVFGPAADAETFADGATVVLEMEWINPSETAAGQYNWILDNSVVGLYSVSDDTTFEAQYSESYTPVSLRFPS